MYHVSGAFHPGITEFLRFKIDFELSSSYETQRSNPWFDGISKNKFNSQRIEAISWNQRTHRESLGLVPDKGIFIGVRAS